MAISTGMDVGQVRQLATQMSNAASKLTELAAGLGNQLGSTPWEGADKQAFVGAWNSMDQTIKRVSGMLEETGSRLRDEATQQEQASQT